MVEPPVPDRECKLSDDGGRGGIGDVARGVAAVDGEKTDEIEGRAFKRVDEDGIVRRSAAGLEDGVDGRVGGTLYSRPRILLVELVCVLAREDAVGASYRGIWDEGPALGTKDGPRPDWLKSMSEDSEAWRVRCLGGGGEAGLRPE